MRKDTRKRWAFAASAICVCGAVVVACGDDDSSSSSNADETTITAATPDADPTTTTAAAPDAEPTTTTAAAPDADPTTTTAATPDAETTTTASPDTDPFVIFGSFVPIEPDASYDIVSCVRSGEAGLMLEATNADDPSMTLKIEADGAGVGTIELPGLIERTETQLEVVDGNPVLENYGDFDPEPDGSLRAKHDPFIVVVSC